MSKSMKREEFNNTLDNVINYFSCPEDNMLDDEPYAYDEDDMLMSKDEYDRAEYIREHMED